MILICMSSHGTGRLILVVHSRFQTISFIHSYLSASNGSIDKSKSTVLDTSEYVVICDEAHNMQSMSTQRTKNALKLIEARK